MSGQNKFIPVQSNKYNPQGMALSNKPNVNEITLDNVKNVILFVFLCLWFGPTSMILTVVIMTFLYSPENVFPWIQKKGTQLIGEIMFLYQYFMTPPSPPSPPPAVNPVQKSTMDRKKEI